MENTPFTKKVRRFVDSGFVKYVMNSLLGIEEIPSLVYFEETIPHLFEGNLENPNEVLGWLLHQMKTEEIEHVTDEMLDLLKIEHKYVAVLFCK